MIPKKKGMAVLALGMALPVLGFAETPEIMLQDYYSSIKAGSAEGYSLMEQVGSPLGMATLKEGDDVLFQGLLNAIEALGDRTGAEFVFADDGNVHLTYDATLKSLNISVPEELVDCLVVVVDAKGQTVVMRNITENTLDLSQLTPGIYMAGVTTNNKYHKTLKFVVK